MKIRRSAILILLTVGLATAGGTLRAAPQASDRAGQSVAQDTRLTPSPKIDNDRVSVWDVTTPLPPAQHDFVTISLTKIGEVSFGQAGQVPGRMDARTVVIALKEPSVAPLPNNSGFPLAFPRPHAEKLLENDRVIVWHYQWAPGEASPMHFHDKDALVIFLEEGSLASVTPDGKSVTNDFKAGDIRFNRRDRVHSELLVKGSQSALITELK